MGSTHCSKAAFPNLIWLRGSFRLEKYRQQTQWPETEQSTRETNETYFYIHKWPQIMFNFTYNFYYLCFIPPFPISTLFIYLSGISLAVCYSTQFNGQRAVSE